MDKNKKTTLKGPEPGVPVATRPIWVELVLDACIIFLCALIGPLMVGMGMFPVGEYDSYLLIYSADKSFQLSTALTLDALVGAFVFFPFLYLLLFLLRPSGIKPSIGEKGKWLIALAILTLFGVLAYFVITVIFSTVTSGEKAIFLAGVLTGIYDVLIYKLYLEQRTLSNHLFWEIFRFAIVGLVAAVFDFLTCYLVQFVAFGGKEAAYVTIIATCCGFLVGVTINYLMSTYMVYKAAHSDFGKSTKGIVLFVGLSALGLVLGIFLQWFFYDFLCLTKNIAVFSYPVDFVIRTLVVMVYNYVTRKLFIYK
jgi:putative flippase GtrA